ncbi:glutamate receptor ionotropic, kainate 5-like isoform X3 [Dermacentor andersoni]|uniref:glutamate receptor ionotropic, kainate 5-like isoform X3 n=1 Tax=Dermacentor andersoni TaxID=34620 RepID=UPI003B3A3D38
MTEEMRNTSSTKWPPYQTAMYRDGKLFMAGAGGNALNAVASSLNFTYTLIQALNYGVRLPNGSWTGMVGALQRGEADAAMSVMALSYERHSIVRFGPCIDTIAFSMLSSSSPAHFDAFSYIHAFGIEVWLAVLVCIICLSCLLALSSWKTLSIRRRNCATFFHWAYCYCWELLGLLFTESSPRRYSLTSQRLLVTVWLMTVVVLSNSFGSLLKSKQAVFNFKPEVDGVDDLAARPHLTPIIPRGNYFEAFAEYSPSKSVKKVWERSRARGAFYMPTQLFSDSTMAQVAAHRAVVLCERGSILFHMAGFCERQNIRTFVVASQPLDKSPYGYIFSQHFDEDFFRKLFVKFRRLQETGLMPKWMADSQGKWERCIQSKDNIVKSISLMDTMPFFLLWGFMCGLAFCALLSELGLTRLLQGLRASRH